MGELAGGATEREVCSREHAVLPHMTHLNVGKAQRQTDRVHTQETETFSQTSLRSHLNSKVRKLGPSVRVWSGG